MKKYNLDSFKSGKNVDSYAKNAVMIFRNKGKNIWDGKIEHVCCKYSDTILIKLKPNDEIPFHKHLSCEEVAFVLSGNGHFNYQGKKILLKKNDLVFFEDNLPHNYIAGKKGLNILVFHGSPMKDRQLVKL